MASYYIRWTEKMCHLGILSVWSPKSPMDTTTRFGDLLKIKFVTPC